MERRKALSSLHGDDCVAYRDFLATPGPEWTGPRNAQRWSEDWRPFEGPLAHASQAAAMTIVRAEPADPRLKVDLKPGDQPRTWILLITPSSTAEPFNTRVELISDDQRRFRVYARVL